ncbi:hypothetical protein EST38_g8349 [Candolleomyces aberdarensis]|uniref:Uncharacterized protein n=1 Tax=Candolleomyces aberdarensis TaxID=2316362 RepID=A0A4Q2DCP5_9AGAR|nr:hypothetical protein EST38_g8349 [Candolleomyces aberdarensis]
MPTTFRAVSAPSSWHAARLPGDSRTALLVSWYMTNYITRRELRGIAVAQLLSRFGVPSFTITINPALTALLGSNVDDAQRSLRGITVGETVSRSGVPTLTIVITALNASRISIEIVNHQSSEEDVNVEEVD